MTLRSMTQKQWERKVAGMIYTKSEPPVRVERLVRHRVCHVCGSPTKHFPKWDTRFWACRPCWNGYVAFRRAYKAEHGHYPTIETFRSDDDMPNDKCSHGADNSKA